MRLGKVLLLMIVAGLALTPSHAVAAARSGRDKSRSAKTRSEKSARSNSSKTKKTKHTGDSARGEFEQQWDKQQVEPELPESE
jgi:Flp pilus assembly protein TadB